MTAIQREYLKLIRQRHKAGKMSAATLAAQVKAAKGMTDAQLLYFVLRERDLAASPAQPGRGRIEAWTNHS